VVAIDAMPIPVLVDLVNGWASIPRHEDGRDSAPYPSIADLAGRLGFPTPALSDQELAATADRIYPVFTAPDAGRRAELVTEFLDETDVRAGLRLERAGPRRGWSVSDPRAALLAASAITLREFLADHDPDRLGVCTGRRCVDVFVDASPGGRRRFCSVTCQNRTRVAAYRGRRNLG
jgi:predicted RNA-binding Zn ribbon-like protein